MRSDGCCKNVVHVEHHVVVGKAEKMRWLIGVAHVNNSSNNIKIVCDSRSNDVDYRSKYRYRDMYIYVQE